MHGIAERGTSKFAFVELHQKAGKMAAAAFLRNLIAAMPYTIHIVLTPSHGLPGKPLPGNG